MRCITRYQGAIIHNDHILLIKHRQYDGRREYWVLPGGGREKGESEEECVKREIKEETNLDVDVERVLINIPGQPGNIYRFFKTYLCKPLTHNAKPGSEPEAGVGYEISDVGWFDLRNETEWPRDETFKRYFYPMLKKIQNLLGYSSSF